MSGSNRNFVLAYVFLVILPLLGLAGILKAGRNVRAPASIDGLWTLRVDSAEIDSLPCAKVLVAAPDKRMVIAQSGKSFVVSFPGGPNLSGSGTLDGTTLRAALMSPPEAPDSCMGGGQVSLIASVDRNVEPNMLTGSLSALDCESCAAIPFRAERQAPIASKGGR
jgi:hypothetical protein